MAKREIMGGAHPPARVGSSDLARRTFYRVRLGKTPARAEAAGPFAEHADAPGTTPSPLVGRRTPQASPAQVWSSAPVPGRL